MKSRRAILTLIASVLAGLACNSLFSAEPDCKTLFELQPNSRGASGSSAQAVENAAALLARHPDSRAIFADILDARGFSFGEYLLYQAALEDPAAVSDAARREEIKKACKDLVERDGATWFRAQGSPEILLNEQARIVGLRFQSAKNFLAFTGTDPGGAAALFQHLKMDTLSIAVGNRDGVARLFRSPEIPSSDSRSQKWLFSAFLQAAGIRELRLETQDSGAENGFEADLPENNAAYFQPLAHEQQRAVRLAAAEQYYAGFQNLETLRIANLGALPFGLFESLRRMRQLQTLQIAEPGPSLAELLQVIPTLPKLEELAIHSTFRARLLPPQAQVLAGMATLRRLDLSNSIFSFESMLILGRMPKLESLILGAAQTNVGSGNLEFLFQNPSLRHFKINRLIFDGAAETAAFHKLHPDALVTARTVEWFKAPTESPRTHPVP